MAVVYCPACGNAVNEGAKFCAVCGKNLEENATVTEKEPVVTQPQKKGGHKKVIILVASIVVVIALAVTLTYYFAVARPRMIEEQNQAICVEAMNLCDQEDFEEARGKLGEIPEYESVPQLLEEINYAEACALKADEEYDKALALLEQIPDYEGVTELKEEIIFIQAEALADDKDYEGARKLLKDIPDYSGVQELLDSMTYDEAVALLDEGKYDEGEAKLDEIPDYEGVAELKEEIRYESYVYACVQYLAEEVFAVDFTVKNARFYQSSDISDIMKENYNCTDEQCDEYPAVLLTLALEDGDGGTEDIYTINFYNNDDDTYECFGECWELDESYYETYFDFLYPDISYDDLYEDEDLQNDVYEYIVCVLINELRDSGKEVGSVNKERINQVLSDSSFHFDNYFTPSVKPLAL